MSWTDDPEMDARRHQDEEDEWLDSLPVCAYCGDPIQDEKLIDFDGELYCRECFFKEHEKWTEDYISD